MGYMAVWDFFLNMISPISSKVPYLTANAVGAEVARGDIDAVYHGELLRRSNKIQ